MSILKTGTLTVVAGGVAQNLNLGFVPSKFYMRNDTILVSGTVTGVVEVWYDEYMAGLSTPYNVIDTCTAGVPAISRLAATTTGITPVQTSDEFLYVPNQQPYIDTTRVPMGASTNLRVTDISNAANASVTATHSFTSADIGVTVVTFHIVARDSMIQINGLSGVIQSVTSTTSFTVNIDTTNFTDFNGARAEVANVITGAPANTLYGNVSLPTAEANLGFVGLHLGTSVMVNTGDVWYYEAILNSPGIC